MKKILILAMICLLSQSSAFAQSVYDCNLRMSDVHVYSEKTLFGFKSAEGKITLKAAYKKIIRLGDQNWLVQKKNKFGIMDSCGNYLVAPKFRHAERFFGKYALLGNDKDYGLFSEKGDIIIPPEYQKIAPLFNNMFLTCKDYKYGVTDKDGKILLDNDFDDIYMPNPKTMKIKYEGEWFEIERSAHTSDITLPKNVKQVTYGNKDYKITYLITDTGLISGYSALTATDYFLKVFSSISPAYEQTIDDLMLSNGADTFSIFIKLGWIPRFPYTYAKKYAQNIRTPNNGPLSDIRDEVKKQMR